MMSREELAWLVQTIHDLGLELVEVDVHAGTAVVRVPPLTQDTQQP